MINNNSLVISQKNNYIFKNIFNSNYIYFDYIFFMNYNFILSKRFFLLSRVYMNLVKNFLNFYYIYLSSNLKFLTLDYQYNFFNLLNFTNNELIKYNYFLNVPQKVFKKQQFLILFRNFIVSNNIKLIVIFDIEVYGNFLNFFNTINLYVCSFVNYNYNNSYIDFFIFKSSFFYNFEKTLYYSYLYSIYNLVLSQKFLFFKKNYLYKYTLLK